MNKSSILWKTHKMEGCLCIHNKPMGGEYCVASAFGITVVHKIGEWELNQPHDLVAISRVVKDGML